MEFYLPKTKGERVQPPGEEGIWTDNEALLSDLPEDLDIEAQVTVDVLTAIPTVWARPLLFAGALLDSHHPLHKEVLGEWRGLLGIFCLKGFYGYKLDAKEFDIKKSTDEDFEKVINTLLPDSSWRKIYLIYVDERLIGGTSPRSLYFTASEYICPRTIPWVNEEGRLIDPLEYFKSQSIKNWQKELKALRKWIMKVSDDIWRLKSSIISDQERNDILTLLSDWRGQVEENISEKSQKDDEELDYGSKIIKEEPYSVASGSMVGKREREQLISDFLLDSTRKTTEDSPIVMWKDGWDEYEDCRVWGSYTPKEVPIPVEASGSKLLGDRISHPYIRPELTFFTNRILKLPLIKENILLFTDQDYLPPLKREILEYFSPKDLQRIFSWRKSEEGIEAVLRLPLKAKPNESTKRFAEVSRVYKDEDIVQVEIPPHMVVWPNFKTDNWKHYYFLREVIGEFEKETVKYEPIPSNNGNSYPKKRPDSLLWKLEEFPDAIVCTREKEDIGLIVLKEAETRASTGGKWIVSVDFGTFNTCVFKRERSNEDPKPLMFQNRCVQITGTIPDYLRRSLFLRFFPLLENPIKAGTFCTHYLEFKPMQTKELVEHGIIPFDDAFVRLDNFWLGALGEKIEHIKVNLKWALDPEERSLIELFHKQVLLMIAAEARYAGVKEIELRWSYPTAFPPRIRNDFNLLWGESGPLEHALKVFGLKIKESELQNETESLAVCKYATHILKAAPVATERPQIIVDIGGGTSDVAVWLKGRILAQTSIRLAGGIVTDYLKKSPEFRKELAEITDIEQGIIDKIAEIRSFVIMNLILKKKEKEILRKIPTIGIKHHFKLARSIIFFGYSAVLYYVGLLLRNLIPKESQTDCNIYLCGNGARLLKWVSDSKATEKAFAEILRSSVRNYLNINKIRIIFSENPKQEVAIGLLYTLAESGITEGIPENPLVIVGEDGYKSSGNLLGWDTDLYEQPENLNPDKMQVPSEFPELENFIDAYNAETSDINLVKAPIVPSEIKAQIEQYLGRFAAQKKEDMASVQPLFIEEAKIILDEMIES
jgi:hypothetical protein